MKKLYIYLSIAIGVLCSCGGSDESSVEEENLAPTTPVISYPLSNTLCVESPIRFQWQASTDPENDLITYKLEVSEDSDFANLVADRTTTLSAEIVELDKGLSYYWRIKAIDNKTGESEYSPSTQFLTEGDGVSNHLPFAPELVSPKLYSVIEGTGTTLGWTASDPDGDILTYDVYLDTTSFPTTKVAENQTDNSFEINNLTVATTYYFRVVVKDDKGGATLGSTWTFSTK